MARAIIKIKDKYLEWSTVVDSPVTYGMTLDELKSYYKDEYGRRGLERLQFRLERVEKTGTSYFYPKTVEEVIGGNRAGPGETELTLDEIYWTYCLRQPLKSGWNAT